VLKSWSSAVRGMMARFLVPGMAVALHAVDQRRFSFCHKDHGDHSHRSMPAKYQHNHDESDREHLLLAIPKKGRLAASVAKLLAGSGIEFARKERLDIAHCTNLPISLVFLPAADIATYVGQGNVDLGITGEDVVAESHAKVETLLKLGMGKCNLSLQVPISSTADARSLAGKRIATSFPNVTNDFFRRHETGTATEIQQVSGSVEVACGLGLADAIVDLVETGTTMRAAGLKEIAVILQSETVLISNPSSRHQELIETIRRRFSGYLVSEAWQMVTYNVHRSDLATVIQITPGKRSPSITQLDNSEWVSVQALVPKSGAAGVMDQLEAAGATDILLMGLNSCRMQE